MQLVINGVTQTLPNVATIRDLLQTFGKDTGSVAIACNGQFVPRQDYENFALNLNDVIEIVAPMQGG